MKGFAAAVLRLACVCTTEPPSKLILDDKKLQIRLDRRAKTRLVEKELEPPSMLLSMLFCEQFLRVNTQR